MSELQPQSRSEPGRDRVIGRVISVFPGFLRPEPLRLFGSPEMRADFFEPIFSKQIERERINPAQAAAYRQQILDGGVNQGVRYFLQDSTVGTAVSWTIPKLVTPGLAFWLSQQGRPDLAAALIAYDFTANPFATPYFAFRAVQEYRHSKQQLAEKEDMSKQDQRVELRKRAKVLAGIAALSLVPVPPLPWLPGVTMSYYRNEGLSKTMATYHWDNLKDSRLGRAIAAVKESKLGRGVGIVGREIASSFPHPDL